MACGPPSLTWDSAGVPHEAPHSNRDVSTLRVAGLWGGVLGVENSTFDTSRPANLRRQPDCQPLLNDRASGFWQPSGGYAVRILRHDSTMPSGASMSWEDCPAVERIPGKLSGAWVFVDTRVPVGHLFANLECGASLTDFLEWFPMEEWKPRAVLDHLAKALGPSYPN